MSQQTKIIGTQELVFVRDETTYKISLACQRQPSDPTTEPRGLYEVTQPDGNVVLVLAENEQGAASQAAIGKEYTYDREKEIEAASVVKRVPFRIRGWGTEEF